MRRGVGYVPEDRDVFAGLTVEENLRLAERSANPRYDLVYDLFPELRERGAATRRDTLGWSAADGCDRACAAQRERVCCSSTSRRRGSRPLLVTEVAAALERAVGLATIVLVEQNLGVVQRLAQDVVVIDGGRVVHTGPAGELLGDQARDPPLPRRPRRGALT